MIYLIILSLGKIKPKIPFVSTRIGKVNVHPKAASSHQRLRLSKLGNLNSIGLSNSLNLYSNRRVSKPKISTINEERKSISTTS